jgi:ABC-type polysaccharide/polyol phosphate export permease
MYIRQFPAPMAIFPLRTALGGTIHFLIALGVVVVVSGILKGSVNFLALLSLIPSVALLFVFVWSLAVVAGFANVFFNDTQHLSEIGFQMLFYATPIIYGPELLEKKHLGWVIQVNPINAFLRLIREPILDHRMPAFSSYAWACLFAMGSTIVAGILLGKLQRKLIFKL